MDDLTQDKLCEIIVAMNEINLQDMGFNSCADITPDSVFNMMATMMKEEEGVDLAEYGIRSFADVNMDTAFNAVMANMMEEGVDMSSYGVNSFDDLTAEILFKILADNGVEISEEDKENITMNFDETKSALKSASMQLQETVQMAIGVEENSEDGAYSVLASCAAVATAVAALAF